VLSAGAAGRFFPLCLLAARLAIVSVGWLLSAPAVH
jgi:hypothetical protein